MNKTILTKLSCKESFETGLEYVHNITFKDDLKMMLKAVSSVISVKGVSPEGAATMQEFTGEEREYAVEVTF